MKTILVTGATGNVGRHIVTQLRDARLTVRALSRDLSASRLPAGTADGAAGVTAVAGDLASPDSLRSAAAGADAAFLLWPFLTADGAEEAVATLASQVRRIVFLSASSVRDDAPSEQNGVWGQVERVIERSAAEWVFLRAGGFAANTLAWADQIRSSGVVRWVYGEAARSLIHERDIADVAVRVLTERQHAGGKYVLTGPQSITQADQARIIGEATGLPVRWAEAAPEVIREQFVAATGDPAFADQALAYWASLIKQPERVTRTVEQLTGVPARTFRDWAGEHAAEFRPRSPAEVVSRHVSLLRQGDLAGAVKLLAPDVVRAAPLEGPELHGAEAIMANGKRQTAGYQIRVVDLDGPYPHGDRFAVRFAFDEVHVPTGKPATTEKISVYSAGDGAITREDVYYHTPPHAP